jgi:DNA-directed RNA polymerase specialized sigma24 family protein
VPPDDRPNPIDDRIAQHIRHKARRIVDRAGLPKQDREEVERELIARLLGRLTAYDPHRSDLHGYAFTLLEGLAANLLRDLCAAKRDQRRARPMSETEAVPADEKLSQEQTDLALDVADVLRSVPHDLRDLAERLEGESLAEIARKTNVPYSTLHYRLVHKLRKAFEKAGLKDYLDNRSSSGAQTG